MANEFRVCSPFEVSGLIDFDEEAGEFGGTLGAYANDVVKEVAVRGNATVIVRSKGDGAGELIPNTDGEYSGCIGRLQKNLSDFFCREVTYPLPAADTDQGLVIMDSTLAFISGYRTVTPETPQVISSFLSFDRYVWSLCLFMFIACSIISLTQRQLFKAFSPKNRRTRLTRSRGYILYDVITHMTVTGSISSAYLLSRKTLFICLSLFSLLVVFFFKSVMKTELVVSYPPDTFSSYQDLIDHGVSVSFLLSTDAYLYFKFAPAGTIEKKLWDTSVEKYGEDVVLVKTDVSSASAMIQRTLRRETVVVGEAVYTPVIFQEMCPAVCDKDKLALVPGLQSLEPRTVFPYAAHDVRSPIIMKGLIFNKIQSPIVKKMIKFSRIILEAGVGKRMLGAITDSNLVDKVLGSNSKVSRLDEQVQQCKQNIVMIPQKHLDSLDIKNLTGLLVLVLGTHLVCFFLLLVEIAVHRCNCRPRKPVRSTRERRNYHRFHAGLVH